MGKKYKYYPDYGWDSLSAVREFEKMMPALEKIHGYPVRVIGVRKKGKIVFIYELIKETTNDDN